MVEQLRCETAGGPFDPTVHNRAWQELGEGTADQGAIPTAFPPRPARDFEARLNHGLGNQRVGHGVTITEARLEIGLNAKDGRDVRGLAGKRATGSVEPRMMPVLEPKGRDKIGVKKERI